MLQINSLGLTGDLKPLREAFDGITYFGCKKSALVDSTAINDAEGATGGACVNAATTTNPEAQFQKQIVNDFVIPAVKPEEKEKHQGR